MSTIVITGAGSGMGLSTTKLFLERGWNVVMADLNRQQRAEKIAQQLIQQYGEERILFVRTDVADSASVMAMAQQAYAKYPKIDALLNNAGVFVEGVLHEVKEDAWDLVMSVDVKSIFLMAKAFVPQMIKQKHGAIVNIASISGLRGDYNMAAYSAAKGAVVNLVRSMALNYGRFGIRVNNICPGPTNTPMFQANPPAVIKKFNEASPLGHIVEPQDIAQAVWFLINDESASITGVNLPVSTGFEVYSNQPVQD